MNKWISVKDRLPERYDSVLVCCNTGFVTIGSWDGYGENPVNWRCLSSISQTFPEGEFVTNWQPLPEPPKWAIARPINGVTINGDEYLCDENGKMLIFDSGDGAVGYMKQCCCGENDTYVTEIEVKDGDEMTNEEIITQLEDLIEDRKDLLRGNDDFDEVFHDDIKALKAAVDIIEAKES